MSIITPNLHEAQSEVYSFFKRRCSLKKKNYFTGTFFDAMSTQEAEGKIFFDNRFVPAGSLNRQTTRVITFLFLLLEKGKSKVAPVL
jgi:hypothetical protein